LKTALAYLKKGWLLGIAPEGTRSPTIALAEGKEGIAFIASKSGVPVIPAAAIIPRGTFWEVLKLKRPKVQITFGKPFVLSPFDRKERDLQQKKGTEEIMCRIAALLPNKMHGFYADNPRIKEIIAQDL